MSNSLTTGVNRVFFNGASTSVPDNVTNVTDVFSTFSGLAIQDRGMWISFVIIGIIGIVGNAFVAVVLLRFTDMRRKLTNIYIINQTLVDCATSVFLFTSTIFQDESLPPGIAGEIKCRLWLAKVNLVEDILITVI